MPIIAAVLLALSACSSPGGTNEPGPAAAATAPTSIAADPSETASPDTTPTPGGAAAIGEPCGGYEAACQFVLDQWKTAAKSGFQTLPEPVVYTAYFGDGKTAIEYAYYDIDKNGVPELIIGESYDGAPAYILDIFAFDGQKAVRLFADYEDGGFWPRNVCEIEGDNLLLVWSSGGAGNYTNTIYGINADGFTLKAIDRISAENGRYFHGIPAKDAAADEVNGLAADWFGDSVQLILASLDWKYLSDGQPAVNQARADTEALSGYWALFNERRFLSGFYFGANGTGYIYGNIDGVYEILNYEIRLGGGDEFLHINWFDKDGSVIEWQWKVNELSANRLTLQTVDGDESTAVYERVQSIRPDGAGGYGEIIDTQGVARNKFDENLVGRYTAENDKQMYFEINADGTAEISINDGQGYAKYGSDKVTLSVYYDGSGVNLVFGLKNDQRQFPGGYASIAFESNGASKYCVFKSLNGFTAFGDFVK